MANKTKVDYKKFKIEMVLTLGGCKPAMKYLRSKFGASIYNLHERREDILNLMEDDKTDWVIHFCLTMMDQKKKSRYLEYVLLELAFQFPTDKTLTKPIKLLIDQFLRGEDNGSEVKAFHSIFQKRLVFLESIYNDNEVDAVILERTVKIKKLKCLLAVFENLDHDFIKACRMASNHACDAHLSRDILEDGSRIIDTTRKMKMKEYGLYAMKLTEIWPND